MTDETRAELRKVFEAAVRAGGADFHETPGGVGNYYSLSVFAPAVYQHPGLTTAQQLALSVLVGEPDGAVLSALCDLLIEQGHEYAVECYEKGKREEQDRIRNLVLSYANGADPEQSAASVMYGLYEKL